jgi:asparagine synthase (glutamine-hydrolysing)
MHPWNARLRGRRGLMRHRAPFRCAWNPAMCGIAGVYAPGSRLTGAAVDPMLDAMQHRGPDDRGMQVLAGGQLVLGHLRLSIIDLSPLGHQPMPDGDRSAWIVFNGEIYNYREIRAELTSLGWRFRSDSDTEVILAAYRQWGVQAVQRFRGMFAFALWDEAGHLLHLCRDRFGVKPLYYSVRNGVLAFASESKALNCAGHTGRTVDPVSVAEFVQYGYVSAPRSIFSDVHVLRPGTTVTFDERLCGEDAAYWNARALFDGEAAATLRAELAALPEGPLLERVEESLRRAFEYRMVADVPVGLFLSGGIDSSLVAALLARRSGIQLKTFTIGYGESEFDESDYARQVAQALGAEHVEFTVSRQAALDLAVEIPEIADEPIGDSSLIPTLMVSRLAREHVKVALSGDGADELFGGYARYAHCGDFVSRADWVKGLYHLSAEILERLPPQLIARAYAMTRRGGPRFAAIEDKLRKFVRMSRARGAFEAYDAAISEWPAAEIGQLVRQAPSGSTGARENFDSVLGSGARDRFMHFDMTRYLPGDLLVKVDRASMFVSLEAREPFLDHETARLAAALPMSWKIRDGQNKYVLRRLLGRYLPQALFERPKQGFSAPVGEWLRGPLRQVFLDELSPSRVRDAGLLDPVSVQRAVKQFLGPAPRTSPASAWILLQLQQWAGRWQRQPMPQRTPARAVTS